MCKVFKVDWMICKKPYCKGYCTLCATSLDPSNKCHEVSVFIWCWSSSLMSFSLTGRVSGSMVVQYLNLAVSIWSLTNRSLSLTKTSLQVITHGHALNTKLTGSMIPNLPRILVPHPPLHLLHCPPGRHKHGAHRENTANIAFWTVEWNSK